MIRDRHFLGLATLDKESVSEVLKNADGRFSPLGSTTIQPIVVILHWPAPGEHKQGVSLHSLDESVPNSFAIAARHLALDPIIVHPDPHETLPDVLAAVQGFSLGKEDTQSVVALVIRHFHAGVPHQIYRLLKARPTCPPVINAGDGTNEDPSEGLACIYAIWKRFRDLTALKALVLGDCLRDPVLRSILFGLVRLGADVHTIAVPGLTPTPTPDLNITVHDLGDAPVAADVVVSAPLAVSRLTEEMIPVDEISKLLSIDRVLNRSTVRMVFRCRPSSGNVIDPSQSIADDISSFTPSDEDRLAIRKAVYSYCLSIKTLERQS